MDTWEGNLVMPLGNIDPHAVPPGSTESTSMEGESLQDVTVTYLHRGAPRDAITIRGGDIVELERSFFVTTDSKIPYHRIRSIEKNGEVLYRHKEEK
jgi:uncharacterized protein (UPF0248 family)